MGEKEQSSFLLAVFNGQGIVLPPLKIQGDGIEKYCRNGFFDLLHHASGRCKRRE